MACCLVVVNAGPTRDLSAAADTAVNQKSTDAETNTEHPLEIQQDTADAVKFHADGKQSLVEDDPNKEQLEGAETLFVKKIFRNYSI